LVKIAALLSILRQATVTLSQPAAAIEEVISLIG
jgi:hypothetical protein